MTNSTPGRARAPRRIAAGLGISAVMLAGSVAPVSADQADGFLGTAADLGVDTPGPVTGLTSEFASSPTGAWFVELEARPTTRGGNAAAVRRAERALASEARGQGVDLEVRQTYTDLWSGVSARISDDDVATVAELPGVRAVYPVLTVDAPEPDSFTAPEMLTALAMTGADVAQSELGLTGEGIRVGIIDTGIDIDHPDLGGTGEDGTTPFPTERVVAGWDFVGDSFNANPTSPGYQPVPEPGPNPDDCQGHGTHVAGIVGADGDTASGGVRGVAPDVELGAYRVFGCEGSTTSDIILAALEMALADGMHVVNQSLGAAFQTWPQYPTAVASDNLVAAGVVVVASIGNSGASGTWSAGAPGVGNDVIGVASFDNTNVTAQVFEVEGRRVPYVPAAAAPEPPTEGEDTLVALGAPGSAAARACVPIDPAVAAGNAVLIERGAAASVPGCDATFYAKAIAAQRAGATAVVLYNNVPGLFSPSVSGAEPITIPVVAVTDTEGAALTALAADGGATLTWTDEVGSAVNPTGGLISSFSSYGMTADLQLKPDLGAPGGSIWSTYPLEQGGYATLSGTSMSAPHVAGNVAQLLQAHPDLAATDVRHVLQNTSEPAVWSGNPGLGFLEPAHRQGAGMVRIDRAVEADVVVRPGKLSLGESEHGPVTRRLTLTNEGDTAVTYTTSSVDALSTAGLPDNPGFFLGGATVEAPATVTVPAGGTVSVDVTITAPEAPDLGQYGGYVVLTAEDGDVLRVPFAGFVGDYQAVPLLADLPGLAVPLPALAVLEECDVFIGVDCVAGGSWSLAEGGQVYSMRDGDVPNVLMHLQHPADSVTIRAYRVNGAGKVVRAGRSLVSVERYVGRDSGGFSVRTWDGTWTNDRGQGRTAAPAGTYVLEITAVNALGDARNPDHVETWTSPAFRIERAPRS